MPELYMSNFKEILKKVNELNLNKPKYRITVWTSFDSNLQWLGFDFLHDLLQDVETNAIDNIGHDECEIKLWEKVLHPPYLEIGIINNMSEKACDWLMKTEEFTYFEKQSFILHFNKSPDDF